MGPSNSTGYTVSVTTPGGFLAEETPATVGSSGGKANESGLVISNIPVSYGVEETGYAFGFISPDSISGFALNDTTNTGVLFSPAPSTLQPGIGGITILLTGTDNLGHHVAAEVTTSSDGSYSFEGLRPGVYQVTELNTGSALVCRGGIPRHV